MDFELERQHFLKLWGDRPQSGMSHTKEEWDKRADSWVKELANDEATERRNTQRINATVDYLKAHGLLKKCDRVIDIGCGPGKFAVEFAKECGCVTGMDISSSMCEAGRIFAREAGLKNVEFMAGDFLEADIDAMGWRGAFDLVFSSVTPAVSTYESMKKSEQLSRGYCFQSNFVRISDPVSEAVFEAVLPKEHQPLKRSIASTYNLYNILMLEGKLPEITYYREEGTDYEAPDEEFALKLLMEAPRAVVTESLVSRLREELEKHAGPDGLVERSREWIYSWVLWKL